MDAAGTDVIGLDRRGQRCFVNDCSMRSDSLRQLLLGEAMREVCRATVGEEAYLFNDQFVVKAPTARRASPGTRTAATSRMSIPST